MAVFDKLRNTLKTRKLLPAEQRDKTIYFGTDNAGNVRVSPAGTGAILPTNQLRDVPPNLSRIVPRAVQALPVTAPITPPTLLKAGAPITGGASIKKGGIAGFFQRLDETFARPEIQQALAQSAIALDPTGTGLGARMGGFALQNLERRAEEAFLTRLKAGEDPGTMTGPDIAALSPEARQQLINIHFAQRAEARADKQIGMAREELDDSLITSGQTRGLRANEEVRKDAESTRDALADGVSLRAVEAQIKDIGSDNTRQDRELALNERNSTFERGMAQQRLAVDRYQAETGRINAMTSRASLNGTGQSPEDKIQQFLGLSGAMQTQKVGLDKAITERTERMSTMRLQAENGLVPMNTADYNLLSGEVRQMRDVRNRLEREQFRVNDVMLSFVPGGQAVVGSTATTTPLVAPAPAAAVPATVRQKAAATPPARRPAPATPRAAPAATPSPASVTKRIQDTQRERARRNRDRSNF